MPLSVGEIDVGVLESLELLRPFGMAFEKPVYLLEDLSASTVTENRSSKKSFEIGIDGWRASLDAIGFGLGHIADEMTPGVKLSVAGDLQVNEWNGHKKPQLLIGYPIG